MSSGIYLMDYSRSLNSHPRRSYLYFLPHVNKVINPKGDPWMAWARQSEQSFPIIL